MRARQPMNASGGCRRGEYGADTVTVNRTPACEAEAGLSSHTSPSPLPHSLIASDPSCIMHYILPTAAAWAVSPMYTTFSVGLGQENWFSKRKSVLLEFVLTILSYMGINRDSAGNRKKVCINRVSVMKFYCMLYLMGMIMCKQCISFLIIWGDSILFKISARVLHEYVVFLASGTFVSNRRR